MGKIDVFNKMFPLIEFLYTLLKSPPLKVNYSGTQGHFQQT